MHPTPATCRFLTCNPQLPNLNYQHPTSKKHLAKRKHNLGQSVKVLAVNCLSIVDKLKE